MSEKKPKILIIDDEIGFTKMVETYFAPRGYQASIASRADTGMNLIKKENPDVILLDLKMPGLDGEAALKQILQDNPSAKVIMVTAFEDEGKTRARLMELGAFAHLDKPVSMRDLEETIKKAIKN